MIVGYHHAQITVPDGAAHGVRGFYGQLLGLRELPVPESLQGRGLIWFAVGDKQLHVGVEQGVDRLATRAHLAYEVDDISDLRERLTASGFEIFPQPAVPGYDRFHVNDPFGNRLELIGRWTPA